MEGGAAADLGAETGAGADADAAAAAAAALLLALASARSRRTAVVGRLIMYVLKPGMGVRQFSPNSS